MPKQPKSPTLQLKLTDEQRERAVKSNSGGCLIADAIKEQFPHLTNISVDMATIRVTDRERGARFTYLTPPEAQHVLLSFDQGWPAPTSELKIQRAVHIKPIVSKKNSPSTKSRRAQAEERRSELETKERAGSITDDEQKSLNRSRAAAKARAAQLAKDKVAGAEERPTWEGAVRVTDGGTKRTPVIEGGKGPVQGPAHPNLLRGRNRHFGAKLADPGAAFRDAVEAEVARREQKLEGL